jgi:hypothetical protein
VLSEVEVNRPPNTTWDSTAAGKCIDWFASVASSCNEARADEDDDVCEDIYRGTLPQGAPCTEPEECADIGGADATCSYDDLSTSGSCVPVVEPIRGRAGDPCSATCSSNSCSGFGSISDPYTICYVEDGLVCNYSQGVCVPAPVLGESCLESYYCAGATYCSSVSLVCEASKPDGASCESSEECAGGSCTNYVCGPRSLASSELCSGE